MSNRITDARIKELERLKQLKEELKERIQKEQDAMQAMLDLMNDDVQALVSSSSKAAKEARGKESTTLSHQEVVDAYKIAIERLEEEFSKVEEELKELEELMASESS
ncbi:hypothetical protein MFIFM68171_02055 [Madurella fahalii]|uniref:Uncharacterized protein n=1 Tax=Madurella fahalii TaxID=1157608 RepID=A0ABQ0G290_9PEZI